MANDKERCKHENSHVNDLLVGSKMQLGLGNDYEQLSEYLTNDGV